MGKTWELIDSFTTYLFFKIAMASTVARISRLSLRCLAPKSRPCKKIQPLTATAYIQTKTKPLLIHDNYKCHVQLQQLRYYSPSSGMTKADVEGSMLTICKTFDKITADKVTLDVHFYNDLGLDSLDLTEVLMAIEDEFGFEITEDQVDKLVTPGKIVEYVCAHEGI